MPSGVPIIIMRVETLETNITLYVNYTGIEINKNLKIINQSGVQQTQNEGIRRVINKIKSWKVTAME